MSSGPPHRWIAAAFSPEGPPGTRTLLAGFAIRPPHPWSGQTGAPGVEPGMPQGGGSNGPGNVPKQQRRTSCRTTSTPYSSRWKSKLAVAHAPTRELGPYLSSPMCLLQCMWANAHAWRRPLRPPVLASTVAWRSQIAGTGTDPKRNSVRALVGRQRQRSHPASFSCAQWVWCSSAAGRRPGCVRFSRSFCQAIPRRGPHRLRV